MAKIAYDKPALTAAALVDQLRKRGLVIPDPARAIHYLTFIGYYRLSGYLRYFADPDDPAAEKFRDGTTFEQVLNLYIFDRKLRVLLMDALERIEIAVKALISNMASIAKTPFWLSESANFDYGSHEIVMEHITEVVGGGEKNTQYDFIAHYYRRYSAPAHPPSWMLMETFSFGAVSRIYKVMRGELRIPVADALGVQQDILESWLHCLSFVRNVCAHHARIWNRRLTISPKIPKKYRDTWPAQSQNRLYVVCAVIHHLMKMIADDSGWVQRLAVLIRERPGVPLSAMGFPEDWEDDPFWGLKGKP